MDFKAAIRTIPNYPKPGIMFRDITTLLGNPRAFRSAVDQMVQPYAGLKIDKVAGLEARGFILGGAVAHQLSVGFVPVRKKGKLPHTVMGEDYDLEYGRDRMEIHIDALEKGERVLLVDDLIATGGTAFAGIKLLERAGATVIGCSFVIDLPELGGADKLRAIGKPVTALVAFEGPLSDAPASRWRKALKLYSNTASPFARKCRVIAHELGLKLEEIRTLPMQEPEFRRINPLGKIPALVLDDGSVLIDSPVICEYLNSVGGGKFFPGMSIWRPTNGRWKALGLAALGDGIADAAVAYIIMGRETPVPQGARARQLQAVLTALDALERSKFAKDPTIGEISVACALGYVDFRLPDLDWKSSRPKLSAWYAQFCEYPSMKATAPAAP